MSPLPHATLAKEQSAPEVYLIVGDTQQSKLHIRNPAEFDALGLNWAKIVVVPDGDLAALPGCEMGPVAATKPSDVFFGPIDPGADPAEGGINVKDQNGIVTHDVLIAGWMKSDFGWNHQHGEGYEDVDYSDLLLDMDFMLRMYGPDGNSTHLNAATIPGTPLQWPFKPDNQPIPVAESPGAGVTANSFSLSSPFNQQRYSGHLLLRTELNVWHVNDHSGEIRGEVNPPFFPRHHYTGRGPAPAGWINMPLEDTDPGPYAPPSGYADNYRDNWFQIDPRYPFNDPGHLESLKTGHYIVLWGTFFQDGPHGTGDAWRFLVPGMGGYLELHPIDWVGRFPPPSRRTVGYVASIAATSDTDIRLLTDRTTNPFPDLPNGHTSNLVARPDPRFSQTPTAVIDNTHDLGNGLQVTMQLDPAATHGKITYLVTWSSVHPPLNISVSDQPLAVDSPVTFTVTANDGTQNVTGVPVLIDATQIGVTGTPITHTFRHGTGHGSTVGVDGKRHPYTYPIAPSVTLTITSDEYLPARTPLQFIPPPGDDGGDGG